MGTLLTPDAGGKPKGADDGFAGKPTADEQRKLDTLYKSKPAAGPTQPGTGGLYGYGLLKSAIDKRAEDLFVAEVDANGRGQLFTKFAGIAQRTGLSDDTIARIAERYIDVVSRSSPPSSDADATAARKDARRYVATEHRADADERLARMKKFVTSDAELLNDVMEKGDLGSDREIIDLIADHVQRTGFR